VNEEPAVNSPVDLAPRPTSPSRPVLAGEELCLAELLELFAVEDVPAPRRSLRESGLLLRAFAQDSSRRAARWGAVDGMAQ
jgi:hypothetical protein